MADNLPESSVLLADRGYDPEDVRKTMEVRDVLPLFPYGKPASCRSPLTAPSTGGATSLTAALIS